MQFRRTPQATFPEIPAVHALLLELRNAFDVRYRTDL